MTGDIEMPSELDMLIPEPEPEPVMTDKEKTITNLIEHLQYMAYRMNSRGSTISLNKCYMSGRTYEDYNSIREQHIQGTMMCYPYNAIPTHPENYWMVEALQKLYMIHSGVIPNWNRDAEHDNSTFVTHNLPPLICHPRSSGEITKAMTTNLNHGMRISKRDVAAMYIRVHWLIEDVELNDDNVKSYWNEDHQILFKDVLLETMMEHNREIMPKVINLNFQEMKCFDTSEQFAVSKYVNSKLKEWCEDTLQDAIDYYAEQKNIIIRYHVTEAT
jgi:hypothetical protein